MLACAAATLDLWDILQAAPVNPGLHSITSPSSTPGREIEWLYWLIFWICFAAFVLVILAFTRGSVKSYSPEIEPLPVIKNDAADRKAAWGVGFAIAATVIGLFVVLFHSVAIGKKAASLTTPNPITIQVAGHQWWWEITYPNPEADLTIVTANEIHVPVRTPVVILTKSADVIHSFWAPSLNGKRDLLPGYSSAVWYEADQPGVYRGQCAEFCGLQHAHMGFTIIAQSPEDFASWLQQQMKPAIEPSNAELQRGQKVFQSHGCVLCHMLRGAGAGSRFGPDLTHIASREMIAAGTLPNTRGALAGWILDPQQIKPGTKMPPNALDPDDLNALVSYLRSLQ